MPNTIASRSRLSDSWWAFARAIFFSAVVATPYVALSIDSGHLLTIFAVGPIVTLSLVGTVFTSWFADKQGQSLYMFFLYCALTALFAFKADYTRDLVQWLLHRNEVEAKVRAQPILPEGSLQHVVSDGSGFAGVAVNIIYTVYDPDDGLATAANSEQHGKYKGLPCDVLRVYRLERHWYSVHFYTDSSWGTCSFK